MEFTEKDLDNLSALARIKVSSEEKEKMIRDMQSILRYVSEVNSASGNLNRTHPVIYNIVRDDVVIHDTGSNTKALLEEAPATAGNYIQVAQVLK